MTRKIEYFLATNLKGCCLSSRPLLARLKKSTTVPLPARGLCTPSLQYRISVSTALYASREAAHVSLLALYQYCGEARGSSRGVYEDRSFNFFPHTKTWTRGSRSRGMSWERAQNVSSRLFDEIRLPPCEFFRWELSCFFVGWSEKRHALGVNIVVSECEKQFSRNA